MKFNSPKDYVTHLEYIRSCSELWARGLFVQLSAYQHHAFLDWRMVATDDGRWTVVHDALNGAGVESVQAKWEEMFGEKARPERSRRKEVVEEKVKKPAKKRATKTTGAKKATTKKKNAKGKKTTSKKPEAEEK